MTLSILIIIIAVTVLTSFKAFNDGEIRGKFIYSPYRCKHNREYYRTITHLFIHADITHLLFNMMSLYFLGSIFLSAPGATYVGIDAGLMETYGFIGGQVHFVILYFIGGLFATLIPFARNQDNPHYLALGASGAVSSVIFAAIIWNPTMELNLLFIPIGIPAYIFGPLYIAFELYMDKRGNSGIAHDAHIGGAIFGILYILFINIDKGKQLIDLIF